MSIRYKFLLILGFSQILLLVALSVSFTYLLRDVKNIPQTQRAEDLARNFQRELEFKDEKLRILLQEITANPQARSIFLSGFANRENFQKELPYLKEIMNRYSLSIFEIGDKQGTVLFRAHRPKDFGDSKLKQPIIQKAIQGEITSTIEDGNSGLGFRLAAPLFDKGTILIGQVVDDAFTKTITKDNSIHLAIFQDGKLKTIGSDLMKRAISTKQLPKQTNSRFVFEKEPYYLVKIPYSGENNTVKNLEFIVMIDEKVVENKTGQIWSFFTFASFALFAVILGTSFLFARDMVDAIKLLTRAMNSIDEWQPSKLPTKRKDEIGQMGRVFVEMKEELYEHQTNLEELVEQRTKELNETLKEVQKLKEQQDGDYFLTSLLIRPLQGIFSSSEVVSTSLFEKQKKEFVFRNKTSNIGGDLIVVDQVVLVHRKYTVFMNADAMGKSIQGAGGALVMGTVFRSILNRTAKVSYLQDRHPERWLKDVFQEIHNVFVSFDGHMLISAVIGLIDEASGTLYTLNSEHPWVVLYRDGKASYIGQETTLRKIGFTEMNSEEVTIDIQSLKKGDVLLIGSDGRDDILLETLESGVRDINQSEALFLSVVEKSEGNLRGIYDGLVEIGELTDDLSLLRIGYQEEIVENSENKNDEKGYEFHQFVQEGISHYKSGDLESSIISMELALEAEPHDSYCLREISKLYLKTKRFDRAIITANKYIEGHPEDAEFLFYLAYSYKQTKQYEKACDFAERLRLRDPKNTKNLFVLAEVHIHLNNRVKVESILYHLEQLLPEDSKVAKLKNFYWKKVNEQNLKEKELSAV